MEKNEIETRLKQAIARVLNIDTAEINAESNFVFDLGADSMQSVELVAAFEEEFDIEMDDDQALAIQNVGDAVDFISKIMKQ